MGDKEDQTLMEFIRLEVPELLAACLNDENTDLIHTSLLFLRSFIEGNKKKYKKMIIKSFDMLQVRIYLENLTLSKSNEISNISSELLARYFKDTDDIKA